jgi:GNAT superfamily N-acetyltransferase
MKNEHQFAWSHKPPPHPQSVDWMYYQHALIPATPPHETPDITQLKFLMKNEKIFFARYTTDYDLPYQTEWWYCIKDSLFCINDLKSKRRSEIKKGCRNFYCEHIDQIACFFDSIFAVACAAFSEYPDIYRPTISEIGFYNQLIKWESSYDIDFVICRKHADHDVCGYAMIKKVKNCAFLEVVKVDPQFNHLGINAAIIKYILDYYLPEYYICDGERPLKHQTNYQPYLCKYFGFRYVYCKLHIKYKLWLKIIILILSPVYPFLSMLSQKLKSPFLYNIASLLKQEQMARETNKLFTSQI